MRFSRTAMLEIIDLPSLSSAVCSASPNHGTGSARCESFETKKVNMQHRRCGDRFRRRWIDLAILSSSHLLSRRVRRGGEGDPLFLSQSGDRPRTQAHPVRSGGCNNLLRGDGIDTFGVVPIGIGVEFIGVASSDQHRCGIGENMAYRALRTRDLDAKNAMKALSFLSCSRMQVARTMLQGEGDA